MASIDMCVLLVFEWGLWLGGLVLLVMSLMVTVTYVKLRRRVLPFLRPNRTSPEHVHPSIDNARSQARASGQVIESEDGRGGLHESLFSLDGEALDDALRGLNIRLDNHNQNYQGRSLTRFPYMRRYYVELSEESEEDSDGEYEYQLSENTILSNLKTCIHVESSKSEDTNKEAEICSICLTEYESQERICILDCGHKYHTNCIKQWLMKKNVCAFCKATPALSMLNRPIQTNAVR